MEEKARLAEILSRSDYYRNCTTCYFEVVKQVRFNNDPCKSCLKESSKDNWFPRYKIFNSKGVK